MAEPLNIIYLPEHVLIQIFSYMSFGEISEKREVCQSFNRICSRELTRSFVRVDRLHSQIQKNIKSQLPRKESERRNHALSRFVDVLSAMETRLSLLSMTYTKYIDLDLCCFIPGKVLDEMYLLLRRLQNTDTQPPRSYDLLQGLRDLSTMAMEHFEESIVPGLKAQINDRSQSLYFSTPNTSSSAILHSSLVSSGLDTSGMSMVDFSNPMSLSVVSSPWRRTPLKLDVQRLQTQMQMHSAAIATMTKEHHEQKVKIGEQSRVISEQERQLQEQTRLIVELKGHMQAQEKNMETLVSHLTAVTGREVALPESKTWDQSLWDCSPRASTSSQEGEELQGGRQIVDRHGTRRKHMRLAKAERDAESVKLKGGKSKSVTLKMKEALMRQQHPTSVRVKLDVELDPTMELFQANELQESLSSKCSTQRLLAQIALTIQRITADHSLPVCLEDVPKEQAPDLKDPKSILLDQLSTAQRQLSALHEEHVGCSLCSESSTRGFIRWQPSASAEELECHALPSAPNQGLVNRAQELYNKLMNLTVDTLTEMDAVSDDRQSMARGKGKGKASLKRGRGAAKSKNPVEGSGHTSTEVPGRKRRRQ